MKSLFILLAGLFCSILLKAQESFLVYSVKGVVTITEKDKASKAKVGNLLGPGALVTLPANAAITFICNQTGLFTLDKGGKHALADYKNQCENKTASVSSNYLKYVWTQLTQKPGTPEKNRKQFMNNVGAVSRNINNVWIDPRLDTFYYTAGNFPLTWKSYAEAEEYEFLLYDAPKGGTPLFTITTKNQFQNVKDISNQLQADKLYYWTAAIKGQQNEERKMMKLWKKEDYQKLLKTFSESGHAYEQESARFFREAFLLEQAHFLADAYTYYKKAAALQPDVELYALTLKAFKKDYQLD